MNNCIFNWAKHCEDILNTMSYSTGKDIVYEQTMFVRFLRDNNVPYDDIYKIWLKTMKDKPIILYDLEGEIKDYFNRIFNRSDGVVIKNGCDIVIYKEEIDFINNLICHIWIKQYLFMILCVYKYYGNEWCKYDDRIKSFCYSCTNIKRERDKNTRSLAKIVEKNNLYIVTRTNSVNIKLNYCFNSGNVFRVYKDPRDAIDVMQELKSFSRCNICGKVFEFSSKKRKLDVCQECIKKERAKDRHRNKKGGDYCYVG